MKTHLGKPQRKRDEARRRPMRLLGVLTLGVVLALLGITQPRRPAFAPAQPPPTAVDRGAPLAPSVGAHSPVAPTVPTGGPLLALVPAVTAPQTDPPSPADPKAFNGAGFTPPIAQPRPIPSPLVRDGPAAEGTKGPLYYGSVADMERITEEARRIAELQACGVNRPLAE